MKKSLNLIEYLKSLKTKKKKEFKPGYLEYRGVRSHMIENVAYYFEVIDPHLSLYRAFREGEIGPAGRIIGYDYYL